MTDCMLDIETLGTKPGCVVLSIGAVAFDRATGEVTDRFHRTINVGSCLLAGLKIEGETLKWWLSEKNAVVAPTVFDGAACLPFVAGDFIGWFKEAGAETVWAQGADFDFPILKQAFESVGFSVPWSFSKQRDTRTAYDVLGFDRDSIEREGTHHSALDDALHQVRCLVAAFRGAAK